MEPVPSAAAEGPAGIILYALVGVCMLALVVGMITSWRDIEKRGKENDHPRLAMIFRRSDMPHTDIRAIAMRSRPVVQQRQVFVTGNSVKNRQRQFAPPS